MTEVHVQPGMVLPVLAKHDTYGVSFEQQPEGGVEESLPISDVTVIAEVDASQAATSGAAVPESRSEGSLNVAEPELVVSAVCPATSAGVGARSSLGSDTSPRPVATGVPLKVSDWFTIAVPWFQSCAQVTCDVGLKP